MPPLSCAPPLTPAAAALNAVREHGFVALSADAVVELLGVASADLRALSSGWDDLPPDDFLKDGGRYRRRRHGSFVADGDTLRQVPHRAHWQPLDYNALHGGMHRWFAPVTSDCARHLAWQQILLGLARWVSALKGPQPWFIETHQFRIDTTGGIGRPTPEGAHRDGVDVVAVFMLGRHGLKGGESRVFQADGPQGQRFTLVEPWSLLLLDDERVIHETTPIQPQQHGVLGWRDTLVVTLRSKGFQESVSGCAAGAAPD